MKQRVFYKPPDDSSGGLGEPKPLMPKDREDGGLGVPEPVGIGDGLDKRLHQARIKASEKRITKDEFIEVFPHGAEAADDIAARFVRRHGRKTGKSPRAGSRSDPDWLLTAAVLVADPVKAIKEAAKIVPGYVTKEMNCKKVCENVRFMAKALKVRGQMMTTETFIDELKKIVPEEHTRRKTRKETRYRPYYQGR